MSVQRADFFGTKHTLNITYPSARENLQGSPVTLGTTEPATATFSYTVVSGDIPTIDGVPIGVRYLANISMSGKNTDAANARTLCYRVKLNGTSIATATNLSCTANLYWTLNLKLQGLNNVVVGDVIDVYLWQITASALDYRWDGFNVSISRIFVDGVLSRRIVNFKMTLTYIYNTGQIYALGNPSNANLGCGGEMYNFFNETFYGRYGNDGFSHFPSWGSPRAVYSVEKQHPTYGLIRFSGGDISNSVAVATHASYYPYWHSPDRITKIEWTPTNIIL